MSTILSEDTTASLLGRSLSEAEENSFDSWMAIAVDRLASLLCLEELTEADGILALLLARMFAVISAESDQARKDSENYGITSKKVEDFSINLDADGGELTPFQRFCKDNRDLIKQESACAPVIRHGKVRPLYNAYPL